MTNEWKKPLKSMDNTPIIRYMYQLNLAVPINFTYWLFRQKQVWVTILNK